MCAYSWGGGDSLLTRIAESEAIAASGLLDRKSVSLEVNESGGLNYKIFKEYEERLGGSFLSFRPCY